ncbi:hypothetical protein GCM10011329_24870 [Stakelama pacifica]|nr:hypothetical protein GCM10011329_24870 [Stakelama pacifica]
MGLGAYRSGMMRAAWMAAAWLALVYAVLVPQGFMTVRGADGGVQIVLCSGSGPLSLAQSTAHHGGAMMHGGHHGGGKQHDGAQHDRRCPFAGHAAPATPGEPDLALAPPVAAYAALPSPPIADLVPGRGMPAPPPPSRAPPMILV